MWPSERSILLGHEAEADVTGGDLPGPGTVLPKVMTMRPSLWLLLAVAATWAGCEARTGRPAGAPDRTGMDASAEARPGSTRAKAQQPIDLEVLYDPAPAPGAPARVVLAVTPEIDLLDCTLTVRLPDGVALAEGAAGWRGSIVRGRRQTHAFAVRIPDARRHELTVTATADLGGGTRAARSATVVFNPGAAREKAGAPPGVPKTNSRGEAILELPAEPAR